MARPRKTQERAASATEIWDRIFAEISPEVLLAGALGAIATKGGLTPPLTRMMQAISSGEATEIAKDYAGLVLKTASPGYWISKSVYDQASWMYAVVTGKHSDGTNITDAEKEASVTINALMAGGAVEYMIYMNLSKNPEFQKRAFDMMTGAGSGAAAILSKL